MPVSTAWSTRNSSPPIYLKKEYIHFWTRGKRDTPKGSNPACATNHRLNVTDRINRQHVWERALRRVAVDNGGIIARQREKREEWKIYSTWKIECAHFHFIQKEWIGCIILLLCTAQQRIRKRRRCSAHPQGAGGGVYLP